MDDLETEKRETILWYESFRSDENMDYSDGLNEYVYNWKNILAKYKLFNEFALHIDGCYESGNEMFDERRVQEDIFYFVCQIVIPDLSYKPGAERAVETQVHFEALAGANQWMEQGS